MPYFVVCNTFDTINGVVCKWGKKITNEFGSVTPVGYEDM